MTEQTYKLYAVKTAMITNDTLKDFEFTLISTASGGRYCLVFTDNILDKPFCEVKKEVSLSDEEKTWLRNCKLIVNTRYLKEHEQESVDFLDEFLKCVEKELKAEKEKK